MKQKKKTEKQLQKEKKIKTALKWGAVGLGWSVLLVAFIGLLCLGIKGCADKDQNNNTAEVDLQNLKPRKVTTGSVSLAYADTYYYVGFNPTQVRDLSSDYDTSYQVGGFINDTEYYFITCNASVSSEQKYFRIRFWTSDTTYLEQYSTATASSASLLNSDFNVGDLIVLNDDVNNGYPLTWWLYHATYNYQNYSIDFNDQINYFAPLGVGLDYFVTGSYQGAYPLFRGLFTDSEGNAYNEMGISYFNGYATAYGSGGSDYHVNQNENSSQYMFLYYNRVVDNTQIIVNAVDWYICTADDHEGATTLAKSSHWNSAIFQHINVVYAYENQWDNELGHYDTLTTSKNLTRRQVLSSFNNLSNTTGIVSGGSSNNALTLIASAFTSLNNLWGIYIVPGITLGVLVFLPLVVAIIFAIIKVVKK